MAYYLGQVAYAPQAWADLVSNPQNRIEAVRPVIERLGGTVECAYLAFGDYDVVLVYQMPDNVSAAAFAIAAEAGGAVSAFKTTPLMTAEEGTEAMRRAGESGYQPPSS